MRKSPYVSVVIAVLLATAVAWSGVGSQDGSSHLSPFGWFVGVFFWPGVRVIQTVQGSHRNSDLAAMAAISRVTYTLIGCLVVWALSRLRKAGGKPTSSEP